MDVEPSYVISALQILVSPRHGDKAGLYSNVFLVDQSKCILAKYYSISS